MTRLFVLGAPDPEMEEIERVLLECGELVCYATRSGKRVRVECAYDADGLGGFEGSVADKDIVFVECCVRGLCYRDVVDHHRPGDPGYGALPENYLLGSSLGQVLEMLGKTPTALQRVIAAADHCPNYAYKGMCPGVDVQLLRRWRTASRAARRGVSEDEMELAIERARETLERAERIDIAGTAVAWVPERGGEIPEASARYGIPFMYVEQVRDGRRKLGIMGAAPAVIERWMRECGLADVYGDPVRGFAGGYA